MAVWLAAVLTGTVSLTNLPPLP